MTATVFPFPHARRQDMIARQCDRSLSINIKPTGAVGFIVHSFGGDLPRACRDHVRAALDLGARERNASNIETDLLWGIKAIATAVNLSPRQTHYQLVNGLIPAGQQGEKWVRKKLAEHFARLTSGTKRRA